MNHKNVVGNEVVIHIENMVYPDLEKKAVDTVKFNST